MSSNPHVSTLAHWIHSFDMLKMASESITSAINSAAPDDLPFLHYTELMQIHAAIVRGCIDVRRFAEDIPRLAAAAAILNDDEQRAVFSHLLMELPIQDRIDKSGLSRASYYRHLQSGHKKLAQLNSGSLKP